MKTLLLVGLAALLSVLVILVKSHRAVPLPEQKRRARGGDKKASKVYKMSSYGAEVDWFLWLSLAITGITLFIILAGKSWILASAGLSVFGLAMLLWHPSQQVGSWHLSFTALFSPIIERLTGFAWPILSGLSSVAHPHPAQQHTGLYEKEDLLELLKRQKNQPDNRIDEKDLRLANGSLTFTNKLVREAMRPRSKLQTIASNAAIGPVLMNELHKSGAQSFLVTTDNAKNKEDFIGTLKLGDIVEHSAGGTVNGMVHHGVHYINEAQQLSEALEEFIKSHNALLVVVNDFEEIVGALGLDDLMRHIVGTNPENGPVKSNIVNEMELSPVPAMAEDGGERLLPSEPVIPPNDEVKFDLTSKQSD